MVELNALKDTYKGKKIFLTGHTGFKGAWLLKILNMLGAEVRGYALAPETENSLYHLINGDDLCDSIIDDIRNRERLINAITEFQPDFVFHLAAQPLVRYSYEIPAETFEVNVIGTANVLDGVRNINGECKVILITTDKVYYNNEWVYPYREVDRLGGYDPYSASKACAELLIDSYRNSFFHVNKLSTHGKSIAVARAGNVIGGGDWSKDRLIPDIINAISNNKTVIIRNPQAVRPWQHVLDPLTGYLVLGMRLQADPVTYSQPYNFGPSAEDGLTVLQMVTEAIKAWGSGDYEVRTDPNALHEAGLLKLDITKAVTELQWTPRMDAKRSVALTIDWYRQYNKDKASIPVFTEAQINQFFS